MMSLLLGRRQKTNDSWCTFSVLKLISSCVFVCVFASRRGERGREMLLKLPWWFNFSNPHPHTHTSLRLSHPHFLSKTKKQTFLRGIPLVAGAAAGSTNWSEHDLGECVSHWGSLLRYASSWNCWAQKLRKTMLISGILSVFCAFFFSAWKSFEWIWSLRREKHYVTFSGDAQVFLGP